MKEKILKFYLTEKPSFRSINTNGMNDLVIQSVDSVNIKVNCERGLAKELSDFFTFKVPGHEYMPAFRNKMWDGQIKLYNVHSQKIYAGLLDYVVKFAKDRNYSCEVDPDLQLNDRQNDFNEFVDSLDIRISDKPVSPHKHQSTAFEYAVNHERCLLLSPTGSGKSLIIYMLMRYYLEHIESNKKVLIVVPTTSLVTQMYNDFADYSSQSDWDVDKNCHKVFAGREKLIKKKRVIISTWQSIYKLPKTYFEEFSMVVGDECLHPNTEITMFDDTTKKIKDIQINDMVKTFNENTQEFENKPVIEIYKNISKNEKMFRVVGDDGEELIITGNHKVLLNTGIWVRTDELKEGDIIHTSKTPEMIQTIKEKVLNYEDIERRLKWLKKA
ncbi:MAG: DEAD/DEAH box helicase family protein [Proteobacteria bacterium]|nr:DEAD/DEAH box helicase family protein [Pseudomonadota bacterium]